MQKGHVNIQFCGFGGQGIILLSVILGAAAVTKAGLNAVQTQSYGSEARGGECQAEVIVSNTQIDSVSADEVDILIGMAQSALNRYLGRLRSGGTLIIDPELASRPDRNDVTILEVPATQIATEIGTKLSANMVILGFLQQATGMFTHEDLVGSMGENVRERFLKVNVEAARRGAEVAKNQKVRVEV